MIIKNITPMGYGMMFLSVDLFLENIKEKGIRSSKFITYFNNNMDEYFDFISRGVLVPFNKIVDVDTPIHIDMTEKEFPFPEDYELVFKYANFSVDVGRSCLLSLVSFAAMNGKNIVHKGITNKNAFTLDNEEYWKAIDFEISSGQWFFDMYGLRKKELTDDEKRYDQGYAYGFHFYKSTDLTNENLEKCDDEKYDFSLSVDRRK